MQQVCDLMALQSGANRNTFASLKTKCLNVVEKGFSKSAIITRLAMPLLVVLGLSQRAHATLDTTAHTSGHPLLAVTDTELSGTARDLILSVTNLPDDPVKKVTYYLDFETNMDPSTVSVDIEADLLDLVSCSSSWSVSGTRLTVSLTFATPYALSAGVVMFVHIVDYTTPSMIVNELVNLDGIVITDNLDGMRTSRPGPASDVSIMPTAAETTATPILYPSVTTSDATISGLAGVYGQVLVMNKQGQMNLRLPLSGEESVQLNASTLPAGMYDVVIVGAKGQSRLALLKQ